MKFFIFVFVSVMLFANNFSVFAKFSEILHGKIVFSVQVNHENKPLENVKVEVLYNGKVIVQNQSSSLGLARLEIANYLHELVSIRVSHAGFISREVQGISLVNARVYTVNLEKGDGLEIVNGEKELEKIQDKSDSKKLELQEMKKDANAKETQLQERAKQSTQVVSNQNKSSENQPVKLGDVNTKQGKKSRKRKVKKDAKKAAKSQ